MIKLFKRIFMNVVLQPKTVIVCQYFNAHGHIEITTLSYECLPWQPANLLYKLFFIWNILVRSVECLVNAPNITLSHKQCLWICKNILLWAFPHKTTYRELWLHNNSNNNCATPFSLRLVWRHSMDRKGAYFQVILGRPRKVKWSRVICAVLVVHHYCPVPVVTLSDQVLIKREKSVLLDGKQ